MPFIITQPEIYFIGNQSIVPVEGLTRKELYRGIKSPNPIDDEANEKDQLKVISRLRKWIPAFVDETVQTGLYKASIFDIISYDVPLPHGVVNVDVEVHNNLMKSLLTDSAIVSKLEKEQREEIAYRFNRKSGVSICAYYHLENTGKLGKYPFSKGECISANSDYSNGFGKAINTLCHGIGLTKKIVCDESDYGYHDKTLSYHSGGIDALLRDASLEAVRAVDQPISEFMDWMRENAVQINTLGGLIRLTNQSYFVAESHRHITKIIKVSTKLPTVVENVGDQYLKLAQEAYAQLHPPKNNRMDYLVY